VQNEILARYPTVDVRVYAIWFSMMPADSRSTWPAQLMTDPRVIHRWDEAKAIGTFFGQNKPRMQPQLASDSNGTGGDILWDSYLVYDTDAKWEAFPTSLTLWGRTIIAARESLRKEFARRFGPAATKH
jgi:hypothetical protein